ncbi:hypothetical protein [Nocardia jiangxiensis]|uniref:DUF222 domain-containing protein n=1 Tax=Nocardia jiangxiensis TaxID=282685 RepID=A0ABW6RVE2_9NOCA|nr:hypothetical protein [Nocardia jiangxiensis]
MNSYEGEPAGDDGADRWLRNAAISALDVLAVPDSSGEARTAVLADLDRALSGLPPATGHRAEPVLDPALHSLGAIDYLGTRGRPIPLEQRALDIRAMLEAKSQVRDPVVITSMRGIIIADLLKELASRLAAGEAFGIGDAGKNLAIAARDIAAWLYDSQSGYTEMDWAKRSPMPLPTEVDPVVIARQLREAASAVLQAHSGDSRDRGDALVVLHQAVRGPIPELEVRPDRVPGDPSHHLLWALESAAIGKEPPTTLLEEAEHSRRSLAGDRDVRERRDDDYNIDFGEPRAMACVALLTELSCRLRPGAAFGPGREGIPLAMVAEELAQNLLSQTVLS